MDTLFNWITDNIGLSIVISAFIGPLLVGSILDLWLRPKIEARKHKIMLINNLKDESLSLLQNIIAGLTFVYEYDRFVQGDGAIKSRSRVLTLQLENDYDKLKELNITVSKLNPHFQFDDIFIKKTVSKLAEISGNVMRIRDTVEEKGFTLFNGVNKKTLENHIDELKLLHSDLTTLTTRKWTYRPSLYAKKFMDFLEI